MDCYGQFNYLSPFLKNSVFCGFIAVLCILATAVELLTESEVPKNENSMSKNSNELKIENGKNEHTPLISDKKQSPAESKEIVKCKF